MLVEALVSTVRACPEPSVFLVLDGLNEVLAHFVRSGLRITVLAQDDLSQLVLIPLVHVVLLPALFFFLLLLVSVVGVQTPLLGLAFNRQVMAELALLALVAVALFEKLAKNSLGVGSEWDLLDLNGLEELGGFFARCLCCGLFLLALRLLRRLALFIGRSSRRLRGFDLRNMFLGGSSLLVLHTKGLVHGDLLHLGLLALAFGWHIGLVCEKLKRQWGVGVFENFEGFGVEIRLNLAPGG